MWIAARVAGRLDPAGSVYLHEDTSGKLVENRDGSVGTLSRAVLPF